MRFSLILTTTLPLFACLTATIARPVYPDVDWESTESRQLGDTELNEVRDGAYADEVNVYRSTYTDEINAYRSFNEDSTDELEARGRKIVFGKPRKRVSGKQLALEAGIASRAKKRAEEEAKRRK